MNVNLAGAGWFKSSYSQGVQECVEVCHAADRVGVRDSKDRGGAELWFSGEAWDAFLVSGVWERAR
ncbi:DUF397 domain-containing protein [Nocardia concava]|uniref:DUF397 domain-containing protein n=1 Tax=Nocardia concava TaxID=257281 RepID=UPI000A0038A5|nr:DUF397 domain-containing protein [Nocardia concava]